jgi:Trypsin-co-occurring domain 1
VLSEEAWVSEDVLVRSGEAEFWVRVADAGGPGTIGLGKALSFEGVRKTVEEIGVQLSAAWDRVKPHEAVVEFGLTLTAKSGMLTGLLVDGEGETSFKITLTWSGAGPERR